jgi:hypothetical protein
MVFHGGHGSANVSSQRLSSDSITPITSIFLGMTQEPEWFNQRGSFHAA